MKVKGQAVDVFQQNTDETHSVYRSSTIATMMTMRDTEKI